MEHREKRRRLGDTEDLISKPAANTPTIELHPTVSTVAEGSVTKVSAAPDTPSNTMQDTSVPVTSEPIKTPDKSTWQGWAEIENDPVCHFHSNPGLLRQAVS
jgi:hypothetical protein